MADGRTELVVALRDLVDQWTGRPADGWENKTVPEYLAAMAAWLEDSDGYYANVGRATPTDAFAIVRDALQAAVIYE